MADIAVADIVAVVGTVAADIVAVAVGRAAVDIRLADTAVVPPADRVASVPLAGTAADLPGDTAQGMMDTASDPLTGKAGTALAGLDIAVHKADTVLMMDTAMRSPQPKQASPCMPSHHQQS